MSNKLNIALVIDNEPLYAPFIINKILNEIDKKFCIKCVIFTEGRYRNISEKQEKQEITNLYGSFKSIMLEFFYSYKTAVLNNSSNSYFFILENLNIDYKITPNINTEEIVNFIKSNDVDILFSLSHHILKKDILNAPKLVCINRHPGKLPDYAGLLPILYTMLDQKDKKSITLTQTLHIMEEKLDAGKILAEQEYIIPHHSSLFYAYNTVYQDIIRLFNIAVNNFLLDKTKEQDITKRRYYSFPNKHVCRAFRKQYKIFTWKEYFNNMGLVDKLGGGINNNISVPLDS